MAALAAAGFRAKLAAGEGRTTAILAAAALCAVSFLDIPQLLLVLVGAVSCALFQPLKVPSKRRLAKDAPAGSPKGLAGKGAASTCHAKDTSAGVARWPPVSQRGRCGAAPAQAPAPPTPSKSFQPVAAPTFAAAGWDAQVEELAASLVPTAASGQAVERLAARVRASLRRLAPEAEVAVFASSACLRGGAFAVAVPDVDVVVSCSPAILADRLCSAGGGRSRALQGHRQLQKAALRAITDRLIASGDFKFRRSAFSAEEPKVTLLAADGDIAVPFDIAVNSPAPLHNGALLTECGRLDARARALVLLARRWARDRGICHAAKGHFSPYCWTLMAMYFLQVGDERVLPPLRSFKASSSLAGAEAGDASASDAPRQAAREAKTLGALFREFLTFYAAGFDARAEAVSVRAGRRAAPSPRLPLHVVLREDGRGSDAAPSIEDPFDASRNLSCGLTAPGLARWREELARGAALLGRGASLAELLEPWSPPEAAEDAAAAPR